MNTLTAIAPQTEGQSVAEVIHLMNAPDFARLIDVALGKLASPSDWEVILKAHAALDKAFERGRQQGRSEGMREALADAEAPMQDFLNRLRAGPGLT